MFFIYHKHLSHIIFFKDFVCVLFSFKCNYVVCSHNFT